MGITWELQQVIGSFSIDNSKGSKNITSKMNSPFFKPCRVYSNSLKMSNVGEFPWIWALWNPTQV